jgi:hypothetical protein
MELRKVLLAPGVALAVLGVAAFTACGGGDGGSGNDEDFVADLCALMLDFDEDIDNIDPGDITNEEDAAEALMEPFENMVDGFEDLNPPADLEDWHEEAVKQLKQLLEDI